MYKKTELIQAAVNHAPSDAAPKDIRDRAMDYQTDPELTDLTREIGALRAMEAAIKLEMDKAGETRDFAGLKSYSMIANTIGKLVEKQEQVLHNRKYLVSIHTVIRWADAIKGILQKRINDPELLADIARDIAKLSRQSEDFP